MTPRPKLATLSAAALLALLTTAACSVFEDRSEVIAAAEQEAVAAIDARVDSVDEILSAQPGFAAATRSELRRHLNPQQVRTARDLGVDPVTDSAEVQQLAEEGALVLLEDSTEHWIVRDLTHSVPYVTPDAHAMLTELGRAFHQQLDSLGLPRFRLEITSVLRTAAMQADLRSGNSNASRTTSSHEFGTTVDIAYNIFSEPADLDPFVTAPPDTVGLDEAERAAVTERAREHAAVRLAELGEDRAAELKGILGDVLARMQDADKVQPLHERAQPVFHMTVAARYPADAHPGPARAE